jgi:hypothetical protein
MGSPCTKEKEIQEIRDMAISHNTSFEYVKKSIDTIENNHLAHMQASLESMEVEINKINLTMAKWVGGAVVLFTLVQILVNVIFKKVW